MLPKRFKNCSLKKFYFIVYYCGFLWQDSLSFFQLTTRWEKRREREEYFTTKDTKYAKALTIQYKGCIQRNIIY